MAWDDLPLSDKARMMQLAVSSGITDLRTIQEVYNKFAEGGEIHIKPENRGKFTALKERTGHSASWFKENGTPAQKKMATFALNARKWHHAEGGPIVTTADSATVHNPHYEADRENRMYDYLRNKGLDHTEAVALLGNLSVESYLDADLHQINGPAHGLMQAEGSRKDAILNYYDNPYVFGNGLTANEQQQLDYIVDKGILNYTPGEWGKRGYRGARDARNAFLNEEDPIKASDIITRNFLRPGKPHTERRRTMTKYFDESQNERNKYRFNPYKSLTR